MPNKKVTQTPSDQNDKIKENKYILIVVKVLNYFFYDVIFHLALNLRLLLPYSTLLFSFI